MPALFTLTALVSATLLFLVQPMFARMVLPQLGGSPAVWNTALVFYQTALLAGYAYSHFATRYLDFRKQAALHLALVLAAFVSLPIALRGPAPPTEANPIPWMLGLLALGTGLPFFVVSTTGPLVQKWLANSKSTAAKDPYYLYAASNVGSLLGLLAYPFLLEPRLRLIEQSMLWTWGYVLLAALIAACAIAVLRSGTVAGTQTTAPEPAVALTLPRRAKWVFLAFIPSSLMMGVTTHVTTDVAAIPLLWVIPLALYLLSFVLVFARRPLPHRIVLRALPLVVLPLVLVLQARATQPMPMIVGLHMLFLFVAALACHGELAKDRPPTAHLTEFYLWLAVGGALGGVFNALLAPVLFRSILEYPIAIVLACFVTALAGARPTTSRGRVLEIVLPASVAVFLVLVAAIAQSRGTPIDSVGVVLLMALLTLPLYSLAKRRDGAFGLGLGAVLFLSPVGLSERSLVLREERSFFGVHRVLTDRSHRFHRLVHGSTTHGAQRFNPKSCGEPLGYYYRESPIGDVFRALRDAGGTANVAVAGLGAGAIAAYAQPSERWTFYEIDPAVERIAADSTLFCYLAASAASPHVVLGDARRSIAATTDRYDLAILDAYSSDAVPVHLVTREALKLYLERLAPHGVLAFHLSNRYFDLVPVVARLAQDAGLTCRVRTSELSDREILEELKAPTTYAVLARDARDLGALATDAQWKQPQTRADLRIWTDDYSSLLSVLR